MDPQAVRSLLDKSRRISGWFLDDAALLFGFIDELQRRAGIEGDIFEIGAHHGLSTVFLCEMARPSETVGVCDLFGDQSLNVSGSGSGDRAIFEANVAAVVGLNRLRVFATSSSELSPEAIGGSIRFFHVDGGHLRDEALADLRLGAAALHPHGALVLDDPFHPEWPGVSEAIFDFLKPSSEFVPLLLGFNKLMLVRSEARPTYDEILGDDRFLSRYIDPKFYESKRLPLAGIPCRIFYMSPSLRHPEAERQVARLMSVRDRIKWRVRQPHQTLEEAREMLRRGSRSRRGSDRA